MAEVTEEEIIDIANNFLLSSPPGEFMEVVTDVRALLPNESLINESAPRTFREYNTEQMIQVDVKQGHKLLITKYGEVADGEYLDPKGGQVVTFDHIKQEVTGSRSIQKGELDDSVESLRRAFEKESFEYTADHYPHGTTTVYGKDGKIIICISSARFNPHNFWNGRWRSVWTYSHGDLSGHFKICVHYYEDGNVQLNTDTTQNLKIPESGSPDAIAAAAFKAIAKTEQQYQESLDTSYRTMGDTTFKALRRALPITRNRIEWSKIKNYKVGAQLGK
jgi:capping protein alpha